MRATGDAALFTDLYELTMLQSYVRDGMQRKATFELFFRRLRRRNYLLLCGLESVLEALESLAFTEEHRAFLATLPQFAPAFIDWLKDFRFTGDVYAVPEGTPVFANQPVLTVVAPLPEAQLVETFVLNRITFQTNVATKASRVVHAAEGRPIADFGMRRMHGFDAALLAARASYVGGVASTSNVLAAMRYGLPVSGTMAHSYIQAHAGEAEAFRSFTALYPKTTLLVDTYDTLEGVRRAIDLFYRLPEKQRFSAIRLDSGDLAALALESRTMLDAAGLEEVKIMASSSLDEYEIRALLDRGASIDGFGVGTRLGTVADLPYLDSAYKLVEYDGRAQMKLSPDKSYHPGRKQVYRHFDGGAAKEDVVTSMDDRSPGEPLLQRVMRDGERTAAGRRTLDEIRHHAAEALAGLPDRLHDLEIAAEPYPVRISDALQRQADAVFAGLRDAN